MLPVGERERFIINTSSKKYRSYKDVFPSFDEYLSLVRSIEIKISNTDNYIIFGIEKFKEDLNYFNIDISQFYTICFIGLWQPVEYIFIGNDWIVGISTYISKEYSSKLEYSIRLYGSVSKILGQDVT